MIFTICRGTSQNTVFVPIYMVNRYSPSFFLNTILFRERKKQLALFPWQAGHHVLRLHCEDPSQEWLLESAITNLVLCHQKYSYTLGHAICLKTYFSTYTDLISKLSWREKCNSAELSYYPTDLNQI